MKSTFAVREGHCQQPIGSANSLQGSRACCFVESAFKRLDYAVAAFFAWFDNAFKNSMFGRVVLSVSRCLENWISASFCVHWVIWFFKLLMVPGGQSVTEGTFLGIILALGAFAPTAIQMLCFALFMFMLLWRRSVSAYDGSDSAVARANHLPSQPGSGPGHKGPGLMSRNEPGSGNVRSAWAHLPFQLLFPFLVLFMFMAGATVSSVVPGRSIMNFVLWCFNGLVFVVAFDMAFRGEEDSVIRPFLTGVTFSSMVGVYQYLSGWQPPKSWLDAKFEDDIVRVVGTFNNPTFFAEMIGLALPLTLALLIKNRNLRDKAVLLVYAAIQGAALVLTWSRGAWLGFFASFAVMAVLFDKRLLLVGLVVAVVAVTVAPPVLVERLLSSFSLDDSSNNYRLFIWRGSIALIKENLFRGVGLGAESFVQVYPEYMIIQTPAPHAHSTYLQMLIELGLCGFLVMGWLLLACAWYALRAIFAEKGKWFERWAHIGVLSGVVAVAVGHMLHGLIEHTWYNPQITVVFWAWLGVAGGVSFGLRSRRLSEGVSK